MDLSSLDGLSGPQTRRDGNDWSWAWLYLLISSLISKYNAGWVLLALACRVDSLGFLPLLSTLLSLPGLPRSGYSLLSILSSLEMLTISSPLISEQSDITLVPPRVSPGLLRIPPSSLDFLPILWPAVRRPWVRDCPCLWVTFFLLWAGTESALRVPCTSRAD